MGGVLKQAQPTRVWGADVFRVWGGGASMAREGWGGRHNLLVGEDRHNPQGFAGVPECLVGSGGFLGSMTAFGGIRSYF